MEWVATMTFAIEVEDPKTSTERAGIAEAGAIYDHEPHCKGMRGARPLRPGEREVSCPRCGQRFADAEGEPAESHRDLHFHGDEDIPSICRNMPSREVWFEPVEPVRKIRFIE